MTAQLSNFVSAAQIAKAFGIDKMTVRRRALSGGWNKRKVGNKFEYSPPLSILSKIWDGEKIIQSQNPKKRKVSVRLEDLYENKQIEKTHLREMAVQLLQEFVRKGTPKETALLQACDLMRRFPQLKISVRSLRRWEATYAQDGIDGLAEQKQGRVGRKPKAFEAKVVPKVSAEKWMALGSFNFTVEGLVGDDGKIQQVRLVPT